ncbi:TPA: YsaB family lipoprotein, partial [Escherichia coli]
MMMNAFFPAMALMVLVGCSTPSPVQKAQRVKVDPLRSLNMEALCKDQAAKRYNTG